MNTTDSAKTDEGRSRRPRIRRRWRDASLRRKLLVVLLVCVAVYLVPVGVAVALQLRLADRRAETGATVEVLQDLNTLQHTLSDAEISVRYYAIRSFNDEEQFEEFEAAAALIPDQLAAVEEGIPAELAEPMADLTAATNRQLDELTAVTQLNPTRVVPPGEAPPDEAILSERPPDLLGQLLSATDALAAVQRAGEDLEVELDAWLAAGRADVDRLQGWLIRATIVSLVATLGVGALAGASIISGIVGRVERLSENGRRFLQGEPLLPMKPSADEIGRLTDNLLVVGNMLDRRRREAVAATRAKDEFLSRLSHELRTPLTAVIGFGQLLEEEEELPDECRDSAHHIVKAGHHLLDLINELLDISKIETGHLPISLEAVAVDELMDEASALVASMAADRSITLTSDCPDGALAYADRQRLKQVLLNLLSNAIKYNRHAGRVRLVAAVSDRTVRISVSDTGAGIPPEGVKRLFQPFERLGAEGTEIEGSGIGLALTKRLVEAMGGCITIESEVGEGTTFSVELAAAQPIPAPPEPEGGVAAAGVAADAAGDRPVVLYIEDSPVNVRFMESVFRNRPERLEVAMLGRLGVDLARELQPRLVLLDINLPDIDGDEVLRMLKADPATAGVPVVILSAVRGKDGASEVAQGAFAFLSKPPDMRRLLEILDAVASTA